MNFRLGAWGLAVALLTGACGPTYVRYLQPKPPAQAMRWPPPPVPARIRLARVAAAPSDLGWSPAWWQRLAEWLAGPSTEDRFVRPTGVAAADEMLWIADAGAQAVWLFDRRTRRLRCLRRAGRQALVSPVAVAIGPRRGAFVVDSSLAIVASYDASGRLLSTIAAPEFQRPAGAAYDAARDRLYVCDSQAHHVWVLTGAGQLRGAIGRRGTGPGEFNFPTHVAVDEAGRLYVTDALGFRVQRFEPDGSFAGQMGRHGDASGDFASPKGLATDRDGHLYVVDALFDTVQIFDRSGQLLLSFGRRGSGPGEFWLPSGLCIEQGRRIYVADSYNRRIQVFDYVDAAP